MVLFFELFLAIAWTWSAVTKLLSPSWIDGTDLAAFAEETTVAVDWYRPLIDGPLASMSGGFAIGLAVAQLVLGLLLLFGVGRTLSLFFGLALATNLVLAGAANPSVLGVALHAGLFLWWLETSPNARLSIWNLRIFSLASLIFIATTATSIAATAIGDVTADPIALIVAVFAAFIVASWAAIHRLKAAKAKVQASVEAEEERILELTGRRAPLALPTGTITKRPTAPASEQAMSASFRAKLLRSTRRTTHF